MPAEVRRREWEATGGNRSASSVVDRWQRQNQIRYRQRQSVSWVGTSLSYDEVIIGGGVMGCGLDPTLWPDSDDKRPSIRS